MQNPNLKKQTTQKSGFPQEDPSSSPRGAQWAPLLGFYWILWLLLFFVRTMKVAWSLVPKIATLWPCARWHISAWPCNCSTCLRHESAIRTQCYGSKTGGLRSSSDLSTQPAVIFREMSYPCQGTGSWGCKAVRLSLEGKWSPLFCLPLNPFHPLIIVRSHMTVWMMGAAKESSSLEKAPQSLLNQVSVGGFQRLINECN